MPQEAKKPRKERTKKVKTEEPREPDNEETAIVEKEGTKKPKMGLFKKPPNRPVRRENLVRWNSDKTELFTLALIYVLRQKRIVIPWHEAAAFVELGCTGGAAEQYLSRLRKQRIKNGLPVPPLSGVRGPPPKSNVEPPKDNVAFTVNPQLPRQLPARKAKNKMNFSPSDGSPTIDLADSDGEYELSRNNSSSNSFNSTKKRGRPNEVSYVQDSEDDLSFPVSPLKKKKITMTAANVRRNLLESDTETEEEARHDGRSTGRKTVIGYLGPDYKRYSGSSMTMKNESESSSKSSDENSCTQEGMVTLQIQPHLLAQVEATHLGNGGDSYGPGQGLYSTAQAFAGTGGQAQPYVPQPNWNNLEDDYIPQYANDGMNDGLDDVPPANHTFDYNYVPLTDPHDTTFGYPPFSSVDAAAQSNAPTAHTFLPVFGVDAGPQMNAPTTHAYPPVFSAEEAPPIYAPTPYTYSPLITNEGLPQSYAPPTYAYPPSITNEAPQSVAPQGYVYGTVQSQEPKYVTDELVEYLYPEHPSFPQHSFSVSKSTAAYPDTGNAHSTMAYQSGWNGYINKCPSHGAGAFHH